MIKTLNYLTKTRYEALQVKKEEFRKLQGTLAALNEEEQRAFIHLIKNKRNLSSETQSAMDCVSDDSELTELAKLSE